VKISKFSFSYSVGLILLASQNPVAGLHTFVNTVKILPPH